MIARSLTRATFAAALGAALWGFAPAPASAFVPASPLLEQNMTAPQIDTVYHRRWHYRHHRRHCWRGRYGRLHCGW
jgi:hypothetical protein